MSDVTGAPAASDPTPAPVDNGVVFTIGGHDFNVPVPTLWDAKQSGKHLPAGLIANAEQAIDLVINSSAAAHAVGKENLMRGCSLGEAIGLAKSLQDLMQRAGVPMVPAPAPAPTGEAQQVGRGPNFPAPPAA